MAILERKRETNAYLPRIALSYLRGELTYDDLLVFFRTYGHLYTLGLDTNAICNLTCSYCYLDRYKRTRGREYIALSCVKKAILEAVRNEIDLIALVGKEPFADGRGPALLRYMHELRKAGYNFRYGVVTNGTLLTRYIDELPSTLSYIDVSVDGLPAINDPIRGEGVYEKVTATCRRLVDRGYEVWISSVLHVGGTESDTTYQFLSDIIDRTGVNKFYFSPVRNFTGQLGSLLLTYEQIRTIQSELVSLADCISGLDRIILDHPYEAVWRDYLCSQTNSVEHLLDKLFVDSYGAVFDRLSSKVLRKLDIFPHGPWGTARIDAYGDYLADVEGRTYEFPPKVGNISGTSIHALFHQAMERRLAPMIKSFLANMQHACSIPSSQRALTSVSIPT